MFKIKERGSTVSREIVAGITTFLAMAYILALNPSILADGTGMVWSKVFTATAISSAIATLVMAFVANLPVALAPGLGLNAFSILMLLFMNLLELLVAFVQAYVFTMLSAVFIGLAHKEHHAE